MEGALCDLPHQPGQLPSPPGKADRPVRARNPRDSPVSRLLPRPRSFPQVAPVSDGESISTPQPGRSARGRGTLIESFFAVHSAAVVIRNQMRLSTASFTGYPQNALGAVFRMPGLGHNRTRPPPFMGWRGPCATCRTRLTGCPAHPAATAAPPGPDTRAIHRFPGSSHVP